MNERAGYKFGIKVNRQFEGTWSFGCCLSHVFGETYLFINFAVWTINIGWLSKQDRPQGEWINPSENPEFSNREFFYDCSICGNTQMDETNFCQNCGADMRGGAE